MIKAFVTGAGALLGQGIIRSLKRSSLKVRIVTGDPLPMSAGLFWADQGYIIERADDPAYLDRFTEILKMESPDIVLIGTDVELPILASNRSDLEKIYRTKILVSARNVIDIANDKYLTYEFFKSIGETPPRSALPEDAYAMKRLIAEADFPLIVKPRVGARSIGVVKVCNSRELATAISLESGQVVQECVGTDDTEYTAGVVAFEGQEPASIVMRRDLRDGNTYRAYIDSNPMLHEAVRKYAKALRPEGPVNFQFRVDRQGMPRVFEINARFSGTTPLRALAGFDEVELCLRHLLEGAPIEQPTIEQIMILRHWSETVIRDSDVRKLR